MTQAVTAYPAGSSNGDVSPLTPAPTDLASPGWMAFDAIGNIYVTNQVGTITIYAAGTNGDIAPIAIIAGSNTGLESPEGIALDSYGNIYVADDGPSGNGPSSVFVYPPLAVSGTGTLNETPIATISGLATGLSAPTGIALDSSRNIYVADNFADSVFVYPPLGSSTGTLNEAPIATISGLATGLSAPTGIALDLSGKIYVADNSADSVFVYSVLSPSCTSASPCAISVAPIATISGSSTGLADPYGIAVDSSGNIYVADEGSNSVTLYEPLASLLIDLTAPDVTPSAAISTTMTTGLSNPQGIALDYSGNIYVADQGDRGCDGTASVFVYSALSPSCTSASPCAISGSPTATISGDATGLCRPQGIALDSSNRIYVADDGGLANSYTPSVFLYPALGSSTGPLNETPTATISGPLTELYEPLSIAITPTPVVSVTSYVEFGNEPVGDTATQILTVRNTGNAPLSIASVSSPTDSVNFAKTASTCPASQLAPLATCTITVSFTPQTLDIHSATLTIADNAGADTQTVALRGAGTNDMTVSPASHAFGSVKDGSMETQSITVHNYQTISVTLSESIDVTAGGSNDFRVAGGTCTGTLAATTACTLIVTFAPTTLSAESATMTVTDSHDTLGPYNVSFSGTGAVTESLSAKTLSFGGVPQTGSKTMSITLTNDATGPITLSGTRIGGANPSDFAVTGGTCEASLAASSSCTYAVTFTPKTETAESGTLSIAVAQDPNGGPPAVALSGTGTIPESVSPMTLSFGKVAKTGSKTMSVTLTNKAHADGGSITLASPSLGGGTYGSDFSVTGGTCTTLPSGSLSAASCTYAVTFTPSTEGAESGTLSIGVSGDTLLSVSLNGTGVTPLKVTPASLALGPVKGGKTSAAKTVTVTNVGSATLTISKSVSGTSDFKVTGGTCTTLPSGSLAGGASCTYTMTFTPSIVGAESATLGVSAVGDTASPHNVSLRGTGEA